MTRLDALHQLVARGGPVMALLLALSVLTLALILWKALSLWAAGAYSQIPAQALRGAAVDLRARLPEAAAREETERLAREALEALRGGLRMLEMIGTLAPLLGLLGTVLGMIGAFQALAEAGSRADPGLLAGGIWEALLTTAAGMAVAIPALAAHGAFEGVLDRLAHRMESAATRVFTAPGSAP